MMGFEIINTLKREKGLTNAQLAKLTGVTLSTIDKITSGVNTNPKLDTLQAICDVLGCTLNDFSNRPKNKEKAPSLSDEAMKLAKDYDALDLWGQKQVRSTTDIELARFQDERQKEEKVIELYPTRRYLQSSSAGYGDFNDDASYEMVDLVKRPPAGTSFIIAVNGDSMEPTFQDGDLLFVRAQETIQIGEIGLFVIDSHLYIKEAGEDSLISHNGDYSPIYPPEDRGAKVEGKVLGVCTTDYLQF